MFYLALSTVLLGHWRRCRCQVAAQFPEPRIQQHAPKPPSASYPSSARRRGKRPQSPVPHGWGVLENAEDVLQRKELERIGSLREQSSQVRGVDGVFHGDAQELVDVIGVRSEAREIACVLVERPGDPVSPTLVGTTRAAISPKL